MQTGYYPEQIKEYTTEEQFQKHAEALDAIENYYSNHGGLKIEYEAKRKITTERKLLEKHHRELKKKEREETKNG
ncbi:hypothetical protein I6N96_03325 [Enterococcus sp. BWM-S5]|uniref:Uncharacterized protein n=1 Tax=Enterococcus larvae TaxID=2794352 RepID=A0ABS4CHF7_9ENTE|nr:hypothetical protein [Enterococcus larvae]MBP1045294.1 hypothetical protein [Enterococcus larvae]